MNELLKSIFASSATSEQWELNKKDFLKGLAVAAFTAPLTIISQSIEAGSFTFDWKMIARVAAGGAIAYLMKNFVSTTPK